ncbi:ATP-dependent Zn proteases [Devosia lucknowensis]|uniref:ATP-dependent Zn proteases n=1 Tax=Devosia lucknowensis TaxID=1096929 RepID=A0A1Y6GBQ7_9HYPH|nr:AAA family ATPase [Devosia lucknowensis]SMQ85907.1 ATP-dependent Zn proteases [Devosia lucknowensis]
MANIENDDSWADVIIDDKGRVKPPKRKPLGKDHLLDASEALPKLMVEQAFTKTELREVINREAFALVVQIPGEDWGPSLCREIKNLGEWDEYALRSLPARGRSEDANLRLLQALSSGGRVFGMSHNNSFLPDALLNCADHSISLKPPSPELLAKAIKAVTGKLPIDVPPRLGAGLSFEELTSCIRRGSTAAECVDRLLKTVERKRGAPDDDVPALADLYGYGDAMTWALDLVHDLDSWRRGEVPWSSLSAAVVLSSLPGLGKTSMMRSLAKTAGVPLIATSVGAWFAEASGYLDAIVKRVDAIFAQARAQAPCILFLDEIDALPSRSNLDSRNADYWNVLIARILTLLDGAVAGQTEGIILVGATNHSSRLDPALLRPGRFGKVITIDPPKEQDLAGILRQHLRQDLSGHDLTGAARLALGSSGAMVVDYVKNARRTARQQKRSMEMLDLVNAIAPSEHRDPDLVERVATHEAGHAVLSHVLDLGEVSVISIVQRGNTGGYILTESNSYSPRRQDIEKMVLRTLGGRAAEEVILGDPSMGAGGTDDSDLAVATRLVGMLHVSGGLGERFLYQGGTSEMLHVLAINTRVAAAVEAELRELYARTLALVREHADKIVAVAEELMAQRQLNGAQFLEVLASVKAPRVWPATAEGSQNG